MSGWEGDTLKPDPQPSHKHGNDDALAKPNMGLLAILNFAGEKWVCPNVSIYSCGGRLKES